VLVFKLAPINESANEPTFAAITPLPETNFNELVSTAFFFAVSAVMF